MMYKLCKVCGQPVKPGRHRPNEYDHAQGCPNDKSNRTTVPIARERRGCPNCAKALALINQHLSGRVYDDLDDALRNLLQAFVTMRDLTKELRCDFVGCEECAARKRMLK